MRTITTRLPLCAPAAAATLVWVSGAAKAWDLGVFFDALQTWSIIGWWWRSLIVLSIPTAEMFVAAWWLFGRSRRLATTTLIALVGGMSSAYVLELTRGSVPECGCFGSLSTGWSIVDNPGANLFRNAVVLGALMCGYRVCPRGTAT